MTEIGLPCPARASRTAWTRRWQWPPRADLILGTAPDAIDLAEDRQRWKTLCARLGIDQPASGAAEIRGLLNVQYAVDGDHVYVLEANPRASRTVPFASKATGVPLGRLAARVMTGSTLADLRKEGLLRPPTHNGFCVKEAVMPFDRLPDAQNVLGPEMRSTGEVMGIGDSFAMAYAKSQIAAGVTIPSDGRAYLSFPADLADDAQAVARRFSELGFTVTGPPETARRLAMPVVEVPGFPLIDKGAMQIVLDIPDNHATSLTTEQMRLRTAAHQQGVPYLTTLAAVGPFAAAVAAWRQNGITVLSLQERHPS
jgi:carbamoyl-phosphate synthase large subunit